MYQRMGKWLFSITCLLGIIQVSYALPTDKDAQIFFRAESADINQQTHHGLYMGHVEVDQGSTHIRAAIVVTDGDKEHQITKATLKGDTTDKAHYWTLSSTDKPPLHAFADTIIYYPIRHLVELIGHAVVTQGENKMAADTIIYNTENQHVLSKGSAENRTTIIIYPEKKA